jgi:hypothetical protein
MKKRIQRVKPVTKVVTKFTTKVIDGKLHMVCRNSESDSKYWNGKECHNFTPVSEQATSVLCFRCTNQLTGPPVPRQEPVKSDKPKGWKFMKLYVHTDGTVFHKGVEQPELKGTLPVTVIQPKEEKKKLTKEEKEEMRRALGQEIFALKNQGLKEGRKGVRNDIVKQIKKLNRQLTKLM